MVAVQRTPRTDRTVGESGVEILGTVAKACEALRMTSNRHALAAVLREIVRRQMLIAAIEATYETVSSSAYCVRRLEVVEAVAEKLGIRVLNNDLFLTVERHATTLGWEPVKNGGRSLFRRVKRRGMSDREALALSRANRHDPRYPTVSGRTRPALAEM